MVDPAAPCPLKQKTPPRLLSIVEWLAASKKKGRAEVASFLLDLSGAARDQLASGIDQDMATQSSANRPRALSIHRESNLTVFCWTESNVRRDPQHALAHARTVLLLNGDNRRLLLELSYTTGGVLRDVAWHWVDLAGIPKAQFSELQTAAERLRLGRVDKVKVERGKIGRNEQCPCGSGRKYKKCCLNR